MKKIFTNSVWVDFLIKTSILVLLCISFNSCKKADIQAQHQSIDELASKALNWLNQEQATLTLQKDKNRFEQLKSNLEFNQAWMEDIREQEKVILIPIKDGFEINCNKNKPVTNYLFLIIDSKNEIREGQIFQYQAPNSTQKTKLPVNTLHDYYTLEPVSGQFTHVNILDANYFIHETEFRNGKLYRTATIEQKDNDNAFNKTNPTNCVTIDWYLTTTIMYEDGTSEVQEEYLYSTNVCGGGNSGGNGGTNSTVTLKQIQVYWLVDQRIFTMGSTNYLWKVSSLEDLKGSKRGIEKSIFTSCSHSSTNLSCTAGPGVVIWNQGTNAVNIIDAYHIDAINSGEVWFTQRGVAYQIASGGRSWISYQLWP